MTAIKNAVAKRRNRSALRLLAAGGIAASLAGCYEAPVGRVEYPNDYRLRHPITVREGTQSVEVMIGRNRGGLTPSQSADVLSFAQAWRHEAGSGIIIDVPQGKSIEHAAADSMREIRSIFAAIGIPSNAIYVRHSRLGPTSIASIKLNYSRLVAEAGPCGEWPLDLGPSYNANSAYMDNQPYWNLGCASQRNLAAMVDNPADLVQPRGESPPYAPRRSVVLDRYRKGENPSGTYVGYDVGKISDVGK